MLRTAQEEEAVHIVPENEDLLKLKLHALNSQGPQQNLSSTELGYEERDSGRKRDHKTLDLYILTYVKETKTKSKSPKEEMIFSSQVAKMLPFCNCRCSRRSFSDFSPLAIFLEELK